MLSPVWVIGASLAYLLLLFGVAWYGDRRAFQGRSIIANPWTYSLSLGVYCTAWTYFGSVGRAASGGVWFLPIYLGPTLAMVLGWMVLRKMIRIAKTYRITSIADFIGSRYGKSPLLAGLVTLIAVVGLVPYIALQLKAVSAGYGLLTAPPGAPAAGAVYWLRDSAFYVALVLAGFTMVFGARHLDATERHEGMVAAIAFESVVKLVAFLAVGVFVVYGLFDGLSDLFARAQAVPALQSLVRLEQGADFAWTQWFALILLSMLSVLFLPRQFQVMVVENVRESHLRRAVWVFPLYLLLINLFVLPIALGGLLYFSDSPMNPETFVLSLPMAAGQPMLALFAFIGGLSAATGMVIVETIAVSTMVSNELVLPLLLRSRHFHGGAGQDLSRLLLGIRRAAILGVLVLGYVYFHLAGEAYALVSIGLISFAAVAQFAPAVLGGLYWRGGTRLGALAGLLAGFLMWVYTLMLPSIAKSGWLGTDFLTLGPWGITLLRPEQLLGLQGLDGLTHALFWSLLVNVGAYVGLSLWRAPSGQEASQALLFVDVFQRTAASSPVFWRGQANAPDLLRLCERFMGAAKARALFASYARQAGVRQVDDIQPDARLVQFVETQLAGAVGSASARVLVASVAQEEVLTPEDVLRIVDESSQIRAYSRELEEKSASLERATAELRQANEQLKSLDRLKDDFMSSVTHELRTPLTSIRALAELMRDDADMDLAQRQHFMRIIVSETERLTRLVNQVLDLAKIESGNAEWHNAEVDLRALLSRAVETTAEMFREHQCAVQLHMPPAVRRLWADPDRLLQVVLNLLSNAAKFVPVPGGQVVVSLASDVSGLTVCVQDNGPGVPVEQQSLIFERFLQGGDGLKRPQGTGLGLPISRQIVEHFGGRLWLAPGSGQGACFAFHLPWNAPMPQAQATRGDKT
ncbi:sensor histidine kinase [Polaromonas sp. CG_9.11]|uniref:sensor histidine kinase n=1 Tax=Polaromonas sp. CG_9.11 TaxID=2787730 RepID=UPI0018CA88FE|nr:sensor histidine kinase [Polaromonas sp. CG_9.11]MBG6075784.1 Na+/proline symporter/nitrogen-specific signal transduction histidine kinase [Polaromonas sp. CG_9.11]